MADTPFVIETPTRQRYLKMLVYGPYGAGKTYFAGTAADADGFGDVIVLDAEAGSLTLADRDNVDVVRIKDFSQFARVYDFLRLHQKYVQEGNDAKLKELQKRFAPGIKKLRKYKTVVIDSITEVQKFCMYKLLGTEIGEVQLDVEPNSPDWGVWGKATEMMRRLIRTFRDLDMHVIFVAAEQEKEDELKRTRYLPALPGKLAKEAQGFVDVVGYLRVLQIGADQHRAYLRRLYLLPTEKFDAKDRYHSTGVAYIDNPTIARFLVLEDEDTEEDNGNG